MSVALQLARVSIAACHSVQWMVKKPHLLSAFGVEPADISDEVLKEAVGLHKRMPPLITPDVRFLKSLQKGTVCELDVPMGDVPSPLPTPKTTRKQVRAMVFGFSITAVLRWMGKEGWNFEDASVVCASVGAAKIADVTIRLQLKAGKDGLRGPAAPITAAQAKQLRQMSK
jgi:hypothetical protein